MAEWRSFNATNEPDTCLWCGKRLRFQLIKSWTPGVTFPTESRHAEKSGDYEDGFFCGLRCAYQFAVALAEHGRRLSPTKRGQA